MLADEATLRRLLGAGPGDELSVEPGAVAPASVERVAWGGRALVVRRAVDDNLAANNAAVVETLHNAGFSAIPSVLAISGPATVEQEFAGLPLTATEVSARSLELAVDALARLHALPLREGAAWERTRAELLPPSPPPLHRLGFAAHEREPAEPMFDQARAELLETPFGFAHRSLTADKVLAGEGKVVFTGWELAGQGCQLADVALLLATSGAAPPQRDDLARRYARARGLNEQRAPGQVDLATIVFGIDELLELPRRQIEVMGNDNAMSNVILLAGRIERAIRSAAGDHPVAARIRSILWPNEATR